MTLSVAELHPVLHDLFGDTARHLARQTGFCLRERQLTGPAFAQALVFGLLERPDATLEDLADFASQHLDTRVTPGAFGGRFGPAAASFLLALFLESFQRSLDSARPALLPLLRQFNGVYLRDATLVRLPPSLAPWFPGRDGTSAALKLVLELEVSTGQFTEACVVPGRDNDRTAAVAAKPLPPGALLLEDMGFLSGARLQGHVAQGVYVLTRVPAWTAFFDERGRPWDLRKWLRKAPGCWLERTVRVFHGRQLPLRLMATRVPEAEAAARRGRVRREAKKRGRRVSQAKLELCDWNILLTNAPREMLSVGNAGEVRRVRWQIELVFKLFKSEAGIERTRSQDRWRVLSELFAKLLGQVVQQWCLLAAGYVMLRHSARRASRRVRRRAGGLVRALGRVERLAREVAGLSVELHRRCRVQRRGKRPGTLDRLAALDHEFRCLDQVA